MDLIAAKARLAAARDRSRVDGVAAAEATADVLLELLDVVGTLDVGTRPPGTPPPAGDLHIVIHVHRHDDGP